MLFKNELPSETVIRRSRTYNIVGIIGGLLPLLLGVYLYLTGYKLDFITLMSYLFLILMGLGMIYFSYKDLKNENPKIVLNFTGIRLAEQGFFPWPSILDIVIYTMPGKRKLNCLRLQTDKGFIECPIEGLTINNFDLQVLIREYRRKAQNK